MIAASVFAAHRENRVLKLVDSLSAWGTSGFEEVFAEEVQKLDSTELPLQQGLSQSSHVSDSKINVVVFRVTESPMSINARAGIFYTGIDAGSCCTDDPTPLAENTEYCQLLFEIDKETAVTVVTILEEQESGRA